MKLLILLFVNVGLLATGQLMWKMGMSNIEINSIKDVVILLFTPLIFGGIFIYFLSTLLWLYILSKAELSYAYPIQSLVYVIVSFLSMFLLNEVISVGRWLGIALIFFGAFIVALN